MIKTQNSSKDWQTSDYADCYFSNEKRFVATGLRQAVGPSALQVGDRIENTVVKKLDLPFLIRSSGRYRASSDFAADPAFLPFAADSFAMVVLPHVLEGHSLPHQVLREAHRVLMSDGHILVSGFNPISFMGVQRFVNPKSVMPGRYYTPKRVIDWLQLLGFEVVASAMFQYAPLSNNPRFRRSFQLLESIGDRWLPMFGGGYMITAKKKEAGFIKIGRARFKSPSKGVVTAPTARVKVRLKVNRDLCITLAQDKMANSFQSSDQNIVQ